MFVPSLSWYNERLYKSIKGHQKGVVRTSRAEDHVDSPLTMETQPARCRSSSDRFATGTIRLPAAAAAPPPAGQVRMAMATQKVARPQDGAVATKVSRAATVPLSKGARCSLWHAKPCG